MRQTRTHSLVTQGVPAIVRENAARVCQCPNTLTRGWAGRVANRIRREHEALHRGELERAFMATRHGRAYENQAFV